ncbi:MAG: hypothetical protein ABIU87_04570, partial [Ornithinibacter sp.]
MGLQRGAATLDRGAPAGSIRVDTRAPEDHRRARRRSVSLLVMTVLVPGTAQLAAGNRRLGRVALRVWLGVLAAGLLLGLLVLVSRG